MWHALTATVCQQLLGPVRINSSLRLALEHPAPPTRDARGRITTSALAASARSLRPSLLEVLPDTRLLSYSLVHMQRHCRQLPHSEELCVSSSFAVVRHPGSAPRRVKLDAVLLDCLVVVVPSLAKLTCKLSWVLAGCAAACALQQSSHATLTMLSLYACKHIGKAPAKGALLQGSDASWVQS